MSPALDLAFSSAHLRRLAGSRSFDRGVAYADSGRVKRLKIGSQEARAAVLGSREYSVRLWLDDGEPCFSCTCPLGEDQVFCKHCVALGLAAFAGANGSAATPQPEPDVNAPDLTAYLRGLDQEALVDLVLERAAEDELFMGRLLLDCAKTQATEVDLGSFRRAIDSTIAIGDFIDYRSMYDYASNVEALVASVQDLLDAGHGEPVVELCEYALEALEDAMGLMDDSDGYMGPIRDDLVTLHHDACVAAPQDAEDLAHRLFHWELHSEWGIFFGAASTHADVLGSEGLAAYRRLAENLWDQVPAREPGADYDHSSFRFRITHIMESLAGISGDVDELVAIKARDLSSAYHFLQIAEMLTGAGRSEEALAWAERGLSALPDRTDIRLREFVASEYQRRGRHEEAMELMWAAFSDSPGLATYQRLHDHAALAGSWDTWRGSALEILRRDAAANRREPPGRWGIAKDASTLVSVLLWEGNVEAAWQSAVEGGCAPRLLLELAERREADHPADSLLVYQRHIEATIQQKNNKSYDEAVVWIRRVSALMVRLDRSDEFATYIRNVRAAHKPKRNLMRLFDRAGW